MQDSSPRTRRGLGHDIGAATSPTDRTISLFLLKRFATFVATLLAASLVVFAVLDLLPGNAA